MFYVSRVSREVHQLALVCIVTEKKNNLEICFPLVTKAAIPVAHSNVGNAAVPNLLNLNKKFSIFSLSFIFLFYFCFKF